MHLSTFTKEVSDWFSLSDWFVNLVAGLLKKLWMDLNDSEVFNFQIWNPDLKFLQRLDILHSLFTNKPTIDWCTCPSPMEDNGWMEGSSQIHIILK